MFSYRSLFINYNWLLFKRWGCICLLCAGFFLLWIGFCLGKDAEAKTVSSQMTDHHFVYDAHGKRDPFLPLIDSNGFIITYEDNLLLSDLVLEGVILGGDNNTNLAIINGRVLKKGDKIGPFTVLNIFAKSVLLGKGKRKFDLKLKKGE